MRTVFLALTLALTGCAAKALPTTDDVSADPIWSYQKTAVELRAQSCPDGTTFQRPNTLPLRIIEAERGDADAREKHLIGLELAGAWHLKSENSEFGGLSGLDVLPSGSLLLITDDGKFVWIGIDQATGTPDGFASMAYMRDLDGDIFPHKRAADSEGLSLKDGLAFVSFEQNHRIFAYDLEACGAAAHGALVARLDGVIDGQILDTNRGAEALTFLGDALTYGVETRDVAGSPIGTLRQDGVATDVYRTEQPLLFLLTGMDREEQLNATLFRAYDPVRGARGLLKVESPAGLIAEAQLRRPLPTDNFEGVAIGSNPSGGVRIWIVSDNNFSRDQRTLLLALDLTE